MGKNRLFFPQEALDRWLSSRVADLSGDQLSLRDPGQRFRLVEAARVLNEVSGAEDRFDVCGTVRTVGFLLELGAELLGDSMIISENAYQIAPGWLATPIPGSAELGSGFGSAPPPGNAPNIDQRLSSFLARNA
jgi:hypothetical protein